MIFELVDLRCVESAPDPRHLSKTQLEFRTGAGLRVEYDSERNVAIITPLKPDGSRDGDLVTEVPAANIRGYRRRLAQQKKAG